MRDIINGSRWENRLFGHNSYGVYKTFTEHKPHLYKADFITKHTAIYLSSIQPKIDQV